MNNERISKLRERIYPLLLGYFSEGETYARAELHAAREWKEIVAILFDVPSNDGPAPDTETQ